MGCASVILNAAANWLRTALQPTYLLSISSILVMFCSDKAYNCPNKRTVRRRRSMIGNDLVVTAVRNIVYPLCLLLNCKEFKCDHLVVIHNRHAIWNRECIASRNYLQWIYLQIYLRRRKYYLIVAFQEASMIEKAGKSIEFEVSMGIYGNKFNSETQASSSTTEPIHATFDGIYTGWV